MAVKLLQEFLKIVKPFSKKCDYNLMFCFIFLVYKVSQGGQPNSCIGTENVRRHHEKQKGRSILSIKCLAVKTSNDNIAGNGRA